MKRKPKESASFIAGHLAGQMFEHKVYCDVCKPFGGEPCQRMKHFIKKSLEIGPQRKTKGRTGLALRPKS